MQAFLLRCGLVAVLSLAAGCGDGRDQRSHDAAVAAPRDAQAALPPEGKLPAGVTPTAYTLKMQIDPRQDGFSAVVDIVVTVAQPTRQIWLHGRDLAVTGASVAGADGVVRDAHYEQVLESGVASLSFDDPLPPGEATLTLAYGANFDRNLAGLFKVVEQGEPYVLAKSESIQARSYLPGFDEPGLKATFDIELDIPAGFEAIGNSPVIERRALEGGLERLRFATTPPMATYLLSLAVGPFDVVERDPIAPNAIRERPIPLRGIARKGRGGDLGYILDMTPRMVEIFEEELQQPYPFRKLDIVAAPQWPSGATELSAAITYREQRILVGDNPPPGARLALLGIHAHELAHMWFGNLVTPPWWDDLWLKEGFATWSTPVVLSLLEPDGGHMLNGAQRALSAMRLDSIASTRAIREPITRNDDIRNAYDAITYAKSLGVIGMVDEYFGPALFRPALGRYIARFAGGAADSEAFYETIGEETRTPELTEAFRGYVEQPGVPLLETTLECTGEQAPALRLRQRRYAPLGSPIADAEQRWNIPLCVRSNAGTQCAILNELEQKLALDGTCPAWIMPNAGGTAYYRFSLDAAGWEALVGHFTALSAREALSAVDSAFAAFEAGLLEPRLLLRTVAAAARAGERQVVTAPLPYLRRYVDRYFTDRDKAAFLAFARDIYQPVLVSAAERGDDNAALLERDLLSFMALSAGDAAARERLVSMAYAFTGYGRDRDGSALPSDYYDAALAVAVEDGGPAFLSHLLGFRETLDDPLFENASAEAMGHSGDAESLETLHELILGDSLGPRESYGLMRTALTASSQREAHWQWLQKHFPAFVENIPTQWRRRTPSLGAGFCSEAERDALEALIAENAAILPGHERSLSQTVERIGLCAALRQPAAELAATLAAQ